MLAQDGVEGVWRVLSKELGELTAKDDAWWKEKATLACDL